jgi:hypothetical protein
VWAAAATRRPGLGLSVRPPTETGRHTPETTCSAASALRASDSLPKAGLTACASNRVAVRLLLACRSRASP